MNEIFLSSFHSLFSLTATRFLTFLFTTIIIVISLTLNQDQFVIAQQQQQQLPGVETTKSLSQAKQE